VNPSVEAAGKNVLFFTLRKMPVLPAFFERFVGS